jgi:hypothetical protein
MYVREGGAVHPYELLYAFRSGPDIRGRGVLVDVIWGDELVRRLQISLVHDLLDEPPDDGLILFR